MAELHKKRLVLRVGQQNPPMAQRNNGCSVGKIVRLQEAAGFHQHDDAESQECQACHHDLSGNFGILGGYWPLKDFRWQFIDEKWLCHQSKS